ncbi:adenylate kinase [Kribbella sp. NPDC054772]
MTTVLLMGPPGAGKGTHAGHLAGHLGVPVVSTGDLFRRNIAERTELGRTAQGYLDAGEYVPDEVTNGMVRDRLAGADARPGFVLDGYPRTLHQAKVLDEMLHGQGRSLDAAVVLQVEVDALVTRLLRRAEIEHRSDDTEDVIRRRFEVYHEQTAPLLDFYADRGIHYEVDASPDVDTVRASVWQVAVELKQAA